MGTHSGPTPPVCVCEGGHVGTSSSTATPRGVTWRGGGTWLPPGYSCPPRGLQTAAHTSATNSWGKANSPSTESRAQASAAAVGLHFAISTMVAAAGGVGSGGGEVGVGLGGHGAAPTQLAVADAHVALQQVVHAARGFFLHGAGLWVGWDAKHGGAR